MRTRQDVVRRLQKLIQKKTPVAKLYLVVQTPDLCMNWMHVFLLEKHTEKNSLISHIDQLHIHCTHTYTYIVHTYRRTEPQSRLTFVVCANYVAVEHSLTLIDIGRMRYKIWNIVHSGKCRSLMFSRRHRQSPRTRSSPTLAPRDLLNGWVPFLSRVDSQFIKKSILLFHNVFVCVRIWFAI